MLLDNELKCIGKLDLIISLETRSADGLNMITNRNQSVPLNIFQLSGGWHDGRDAAHKSNSAINASKKFTDENSFFINKILHSEFYDLSSVRAWMCVYVTK